MSKSKNKPPQKEAIKPIGVTKRTGFTFDQTRYEPMNDKFQPAKKLTPETVHTTAEFVGLLEKDSKIEVDARVLCYSKNLNEFRVKKYGTRESFLKAVKGTDAQFKLRESKKDFMEWDDWFASGGSGGGGIENINDFTPLLGGPFFKQLYQYDYMRMHSACFYAWHHDPLAKFIVETIHDFVLGKGFTVESESEDAQLKWDIFSIANKFPTRVSSFFRELTAYGEHFVWFLPGMESKISFAPFAPGQPSKGLVQRVRLIDPSCIFDICTMPDDIENVLFYQWVAPTQYQTYTAPGIPTSKFIFQQIPAGDVYHYKINCADDEKRGRSDLFAILGDLKRLRDALDYSVIGLMKAAAWCLDTQIEGNQEDLDAYASAQQALGSVPPAGSEFIHTKAVERKYLANQGPGSSQADTFSWVLSSIAAGARLPVSYFGSHLSGGQTRASAVVGVEPVIKFFESRREIVKTMIEDVHRRITGMECRIVFPEIITQDRSIKIRDTISAYQEEFISRERASIIVAKELDQDDFDYTEEQDEIKAEPPPIMAPQSAAPLSTPPMQPKSSGISSPEKAGIKANDRQ